MSNGKKGAVGIVGLGIMGGSFARNLAAAGWQVKGFDIDPARCAELREVCVEIAPDVSAMAQSVPTIITSLPSPAALEQVAREIAAFKAKKLIVVEMSTFAIEDKTKAEKILAEAGHVLLDCPVSGTGAQAKLKDLVIYASGEREAYDRAAPVFRGFARASHYLGAFGNGSKMKFVANLLVAVHNVASAEAMVLGMKAGLDPAAIVEVIASGAGNSRVFELRAPLMARGDYAPTMKIDIWQKDMAIIAEFAKSLGVPVPTFAASAPIYDAAQAAGFGGEDTAAVAKVLAARAKPAH